MEIQIRELQLIEINQSIISKYSKKRSYRNFNYKANNQTDYLKLTHLKKGSLEDFKKVDRKLQSRPFFLKSKTIRDTVGREAFIKKEFNDRWETYKNTNRVNLSKFLKDMLPYIDKATIKRLKHGRYFRNIVDGLMNNNRLLDLASTPNSYAVVNPRKTQDFYTEKIIKDLDKKFEREKIVDMTKDEGWVKDVLGEPESSRPRPFVSRKRLRKEINDPRTRLNYMHRGP
ncbi:MAG: hypothetical protein ACOCTN_07800 [Candidatus Natronoplasma sp.]